jgi:hypothetical protein
MCAHDTGHRTLIRNRERIIAELYRRFDQLLGMGCAAQKREIAERVQLSVATAIRNNHASTRAMHDCGFETPKNACRPH